MTHYLILWTIVLCALMAIIACAETTEERIARKNQQLEDQRRERLQRLMKEQENRDSPSTEALLVPTPSVNGDSTREQNSNSIHLHTSKRDMLLRETCDLEEELRIKTANLGGFRQKDDALFYVKEGWVSWVLRKAKALTWRLFDILSASPSSSQLQVTDLRKEKEGASMARKLMRKIVGSRSATSAEQEQWVILQSQPKFKTQTGTSQIDNEPSELLTSEPFNICMFAFVWITFPRWVLQTMAGSEEDLPSHQYALYCFKGGRPTGLNSADQTSRANDFVHVTPTVLGYGTTVTPLNVLSDDESSSSASEIAIGPEKRTLISHREPHLFHITPSYYLPNQHPTAGHFILLVLLPATLIISLWSFLQYGIYGGSVKKMLDSFDDGIDKLNELDESEEKERKRKEDRRREEELRRKSKEEKSTVKKAAITAPPISHNRKDSSNPLNSSGRQNSTTASSNMTPLNTSRALGDTTSPSIPPAKTPNSRSVNGSPSTVTVPKNEQFGAVANTSGRNDDSKESSISFASEIEDSDVEFIRTSGEKTKILEFLSATFGEILRDNDHAYLYKLSRRLLVLCGMAILFNIYTAVTAVVIINDGALHFLFSLVFGKQLVLVIVLGLVGFVLFKTVVELFGGIDYAVNILIHNADVGDEPAQSNATQISHKDSSKDRSRSRSRSGGRGSAAIRNRSRSPGSKLKAKLP